MSTSSYLNGNVGFKSNAEKEIVLNYLNFVIRQSDNSLLKLKSVHVEEIARAIKSLHTVPLQRSAMETVERDVLKNSLGITPKEEFFRQKAFLFDFDNDYVEGVVNDLYLTGVLDGLMSEKEVVSAVLTYVQDTIRYKEDVDNKDHWQSLEETLRKGTGDCEDLVIAQTVLLSKIFQSKFSYTKQELKDAFSLSAGYISRLS